MSSTWQAANPEKWREYKATYYRENKEKIAASKKAWADKNREKLREQKRARAPAEAIRRAANRDALRPRELLRSARRRAAVSGIPCTITLADIVIPAVCPLLGIALSAGTGKLNAASPSLDRKDNKLGYVPGNVWVISYRANAAKGDLTADELILMGTRLKASLEAGAAA